jgi:DtxR family Mn-dependent transcriptional regulator
VIDGKLVSLKALRPGTSAEVVKVTATENGRLLKLSALGLVPGSRIWLQQRSPAYVIWLGETQLSLDEAVAGEIWLNGESLSR